MRNNLGSIMCQRFSYHFRTNYHFMPTQFYSTIDSGNRQVSVSLVQGASRGIGLEFVSIFLPYSIFNCAFRFLIMLRKIARFLRKSLFQIANFILT